VCLVKSKVHSFRPGCKNAKCPDNGREPGRILAGGSSFQEKGRYRRHADALDQHLMGSVRGTVFIKDLREGGWYALYG
jgi:hypothetical protein